MENNKTPEIRFAGFSDEWKEKKISDFSKKTYGGGTPKTNIKENWKGEIPWIQSSDLKVGEVFSVYVKKFISKIAVQYSAAKLIPKNSIAIVTRVGVGKLAYMPYSYTTSQDFLSLSELMVDQWFGVYSIYNILTAKSNNIQGTSIQGITKNDLLTKKIKIPLNKKEQAKIGNFFKQLDDIISLHQRELDKLKQMKQGFLQKMFPKEGETVPELRFPEFKDEWVQIKIGSLGRVSAGGDINRKKLISDGVYPVIGNALTNEGIVGYYNEYKIKAPAITITGRGDIGYAKARFTNFTPVVRLLVLEVTKCDVIFLENAINIKNIYVESTGVPQLTVPQISKYNILIPSYQEQVQIGNFFKQLDTHINLHQQELDLLKQTKKAFLQKMFI